MWEKVKEGINEVAKEVSVESRSNMSNMSKNKHGSRQKKCRR